MKTILVLPGDGIGPEITTQAVNVLKTANNKYQLNLTFIYDDIGGAALAKHGIPLTDDTLALAKKADAVLLGAVGDPKWDNIEPHKRPEQGLLQIRAGLGLFANLRPALLYPQLTSSSTLKPEIVEGLDIMIVRELTGGIYFGKPRETSVLADGQRFAFDTLPYSESEIKRIVKLGFETARIRNKKLCSVDKANVLASSQLWRTITNELSIDYPDVELTHMYVDNAAMQLVRNPKQFDVIVTDNMFGDILSDEASMLTGSIGMLASASLDANNKGMYEPSHGSAPDIAGQDIANPIATILSAAMLLRYTLKNESAAKAIETAVSRVLDLGMRTKDIATIDTNQISCSKMGEEIVKQLNNL